MAILQKEEYTYGQALLYKRYEPTEHIEHNSKPSPNGYKNVLSNAKWL